MNIPYLIDIKANILAVPESFRMEDWFTHDEDAPCKTAGCIAGHTLAIHGSAKTMQEAAVNNPYDFFGDEIAEKAAEVLGLTRYQRNRLFLLSHWPAKFRRRYESATTTPLERAQATADRIDWFIATEGAE